MLTKEECFKALDFIEEETTYVEDYETMPLITCNHLQKEIAILRQLINEHFELKEVHQKLCDSFFPFSDKHDEIIRFITNPPLKWEELKEGMRVWDNKYKAFRKIAKLTTYFDKRIKAIEFEYLHIPSQYGSVIDFEENRFYRKQTEEYD